MLILSSVNKEVLYVVVIFTILYSSDIDSGRRELQECLLTMCGYDFVVECISSRSIILNSDNPVSAL